MGLTVSVVSPVYGGRTTVRELHRRLVTATDPIADVEFEFIFVDDASPDGSWEELVDLAHSEDHVVALRLARNVRQTRAIFAGASVARGDATLVIDCDLDDPPELVPELVRRFVDGHDLVVAVRRRRRGSLLRRVGSRSMNLLATVLGIPGVDIGSSFLIMDRRIESEVRAQLELTGIQLIMPTNFAAAHNPKTVSFDSRATEPTRYPLREIARIGAHFVAVYAAKRLARVAVATAGAMTLSGALARRRRRSWVPGAGGAVAFMLVARWLRRAASRTRRDPSEPLYEIAEVVTGAERQERAGPGVEVLRNG